MLGTAAKIEVTKENCTIVGDGSSEESVKSRVKQIKNLVANTEQDYEKEKLNERIARLSGGVAIIQVGSGSHCVWRASGSKIRSCIGSLLTPVGLWCVCTLFRAVN